MDASTALADFNDRNGSTYRIDSRFMSGLQGGAWLIVDADGQRAVLKVGVRDVERLANIVERVRAGGYPTPAWMGHGSAYFVQEFVPGRGATPLTTSNTPQLIEVLERQAGLLDGLDLVHGDFNSCNILIDDGAVTGVIDVEGFRPGTRAFDYACLLREAYVEDYGDEVIALIHEAGRGVAGPDVLAACAAEAAEFIIGFKLRHEPWRLNEVRARLDRMARDLSEATN